MLTNIRVFPKFCICIQKVTSMVKYFTEVRKTSEDVEVRMSLIDVMLVVLKQHLVFSANRSL